MRNSDFCATLVVYAATVLTLLSGLVFLSLGAYLQYDPGSNVLLESRYLMIGLYVCGGILFLLGLLGVLAERSRNCFLVLLYIIGLMAIIAIELYLLFHVVSEKSAFDGFAVWRALSFNKTESVQNLFSCCGYNSTYPKFINSSCISETYCQDKIKTTYMRYMDLSMIFEIVFVVFQMLTLISMSFLAGRSRDKRHQKHGFPSLERQVPPSHIYDGQELSRGPSRL